jgi:hypothetical protein
MRPDELELLPGPHLDEGTAHAFVDGALGDEEAARVIAHVAACDRCAAVLAEARGLTAAATRVLGALDAVPGNVVPQAATSPAPPVAVPAPVRAPVPARAPTPADAVRAVRAPGARRTMPRWPLRAAAGVLLAAGVGSAAWLARDDRRAGEPEVAAVASERAVSNAAGPSPGAAVAGAGVPGPAGDARREAATPAAGAPDAASLMLRAGAPELAAAPPRLDRADAGTQTTPTPGTATAMPGGAEKGQTSASALAAGAPTEAAAARVGRADGKRGPIPRRPWSLWCHPPRRPCQLPHLRRRPLPSRPRPVQRPAPARRPTRRRPTCGRARPGCARLWRSPRRRTSRRAPAATRSPAAPRSRAPPGCRSPAG